MSWWISLQNEKGECVEVEPFMEGGTYCIGKIQDGKAISIGGSTEADLNITYNYSPFYYKHFMQKSGLRWLNGKRAFDCIGQLERAIGILGTKVDEDYWKRTEGNAGYALSILLSWAKQHPDAVFYVN